MFGLSSLGGLTGSASGAAGGGGGGPGPSLPVFSDEFAAFVVLHTRMEADPPIDISAQANIFTNDTGGASLDASDFRFGAGSGLFDGTADASFSAPSNTAFHLTNQPFTIEAWVNPDVVTGEDSIITHYATSPNKAWQFQRDGTAIRFTYSTTGSNDIILTASGAMPTANLWYHVVAERDASGIFRMYVNGKVVHVTDLSAVTLASPTAELLIAGRDFGTTLTWDGNIDEVRVTVGVARYA